MSRPGLLFLCHRIPYPPNKGDKIRSYNLLLWLAERYDVSLGAFIDNDADWQYTEHLDDICARTFFAPLPTGAARGVHAAGALLRGDAISVGLYRHAGMSGFVDSVMREHSPANVLVFSSAMGVHTDALPKDTRLLVDFVDVDSEKWRQYASEQAWPMSWLFRREAKKLYRHDLALAQRSSHNFFVSQKETELFCRIAPTVAERTTALTNGVDTAFFDPDAPMTSPYDPGRHNLVFTGAMDYWPNADAVEWFAQDVMPRLRDTGLPVTFYIVGASPTGRVRRLAAEDVVVTGTVDDIRPYIGCADVVVAPLRVARGIQNKVLEAMAMRRRVVTTPAGAEGIEATDDEHYCVRETPEAMAEAVATLLNDASSEAMGERARGFVLSNFGWTQCLSVLETFLSPTRSSR